MKIGIVCYSTSGGSGTVASELGMALARRGHAVHFIARALPARLTALGEGVHFHEVRSDPYPVFGGEQYALALAGRIAEIAEREQLELIHAHYAIPHSISAYLAREMLRGRHPLPLITTLHGTDITDLGRDPSFREATRFAIAQSDGVTTVSRALAATVEALFALPSVRVIPNFVDVEEFQRQPFFARLSAELRPRGEKLLVHVSNFRPVKRPGDCVEIFARVARAMPSRLVMVGDGPEIPAARALAERLGVAEDVLFVGEQSRVVDYLSLADVMLLPSETESFGVAALEAMSCEVPVVASRVGGLPEVVEDGVSGRLSPVGDVAAMTAAALEILSDARLAAAMGRAGRRIASTRFGSELVVPRYLDFYVKVLDGFHGVRRGSEFRPATLAALPLS